MTRSLRGNKRRERKPEANEIKGRGKIRVCIHVKRESEREVNYIGTCKTEEAKNKCWKGMAVDVSGARTKRGETKAEKRESLEYRYKMVC